MKRSSISNNFSLLVSVLFFIITAQSCFAATDVLLRKGSPVIIPPGIDVNRQTVITVSLNSDQPYSIAVNDDNSGVLRNGTAVIPYRVSYNNNPETTLSTTPVVMESAASITDGESTIAVSILGIDTAKATAGDYSATLTVTITSF